MSILENIFKSYKTALDSLSDEELHEISHLIETNDAGKNDNAIKEFAEKHAAKFDYTDSIDDDDKNTFIKKLTEIEIGEPEDVTYQRFIFNVLKNMASSITSIATSPRPNSSQKSKTSTQSRQFNKNGVPIVSVDLSKLDLLKKQVKNPNPLIPPAENKTNTSVLPFLSSTFADSDKPPPPPP